MPLTDTLQTAEDFRRVGFTEEQATMLATKLEATAQAQNQDLKEFIRQEIDGVRKEIDGVRKDMDGMRQELGGDIKLAKAELRAELAAGLRDQTFKSMTILIAALTLAVAVIKLFPNLY